MERNITKPILVTSSAFVLMSIGNLTRLKGIEDVKAIYIVSLLTCGVGIGAFIISLVMFVKSRKNKGLKEELPR